MSNKHCNIVTGTRLLQSAAVLARGVVLPGVLAAALFPATAHAADVTLTSSDAVGTTSFNGAGHWDDGAAPSAGNDYSTGNFILRTPPDGGSYTFAGDSLTVNNTNGYPNGLLYKGTGTAGVITINNLILDGGYVSHANGSGDLFRLDGSINVLSDSFIYARQGPIDVLAAISGSATITNPGSDGAGRALSFFSSANTFTGNVVNNGRFELADDAVMNFVIGPSGVNNSLSGTGAETIIDGDFTLDLTNATSNPGDHWNIVTANNRSFGSTFNVSGFVKFANQTWTNGTYQFDETTGDLSVAPAPDLLTLRVNTTDGHVSILNDTSSATIHLNYYEICSDTVSLDPDGWTSIDGDAPASATTWEEAGGSSPNLISEVNLLGMESLAAGESVSIGWPYAGTSLEQQDLVFRYGTTDDPGTLFQGFVEYVASEPVVGDYNGDGGVDAADYTVWRDNLSGDGSLLLNRDPANTGTISEADYNSWKAHFGMSSGGAGIGTGAVPEPSASSFALLAVGCTLVVRWPRGERRLSAD